MSSLFRYPSETAPVKIGPVKRVGHTCKTCKIGTLSLLSPLSSLSPLFPLVSSLLIDKNKCGERARERDNSSRDGKREDWRGTTPLSSLLSAKREEGISLPSAHTCARGREGQREKDRSLLFPHDGNSVARERARGREKIHFLSKREHINRQKLGVAIRFGHQSSINNLDET